jgi:hypothetical protein
MSADGTALFVEYNLGTVGEYNSTTGAAINANFITGLNDSMGLALSGNNLFVGNGGFSPGSGTVGEYDATTGAPTNANFITGLNASPILTVGPTPTPPPTPTAKELVWENIVTGEHSIWVLNNGVPDGVISLPTISNEWNIAATGDFLFTGQADLVWENTVTGEHSIWVMNNGVPPM